MRAVIVLLLLACIAFPVDARTRGRGQGPIAHHRTHVHSLNVKASKAAQHATAAGALGDAVPELAAPAPVMPSPSGTGLASCDVAMTDYCTRADGFIIPTPHR